MTGANHPQKDKAKRPAAKKSGGKRPVSAKPASFSVQTSLTIVALLDVLGTDRLKEEIARRRPLSRDRIKRLISHEISRIDALLSDAVLAILIHPDFERLEASWRGMDLLVAEGCDVKGVKIRVLPVSWAELARDITRALEFDQSDLFAKVYTEEFDMPGGEPFGVLIGGFAIRHRPGRGSKFDDMDVLKGIAEVATAAFAPFIAGAAPEMFGLENFSQLTVPLDLSKVFVQPEYTRWRSFRDSEEARFVGLTLPQVLLRTGYDDDPDRRDGFRFNAHGPASPPLWGNAAFAFGANMIRAFEETNWFSDIRGVITDRDGGGLFTSFETEYYRVDTTPAFPKPTVDVIITESLEQDLSNHGFIPLTQCKNLPLAAFYSTNSVHRSKRPEQLETRVNVRLAAALENVFCCARFAHYLKVMTRDRIGSFRTAEEQEQELQKWLLEYCVDGEDLSEERMAQTPLRNGQVRIRERPGEPGKFLCTMTLQPHFHFEQIVSSIRLVTQIVAAET